MKTLVIYDSVYGNTEKIAQIIGTALLGEARVVHVGQVKMSDLKAINLLIVGSPTHGGRPTTALGAFLKSLSVDSLARINVAAFDTRFAPEDHGIGLKIVMNVIRFASERIAKTLVRKGGVLAVKPEGFIVEDKEGPLKQGEVERARKWAVGLL